MTPWRVNWREGDACAPDGEAIPPRWTSTPEARYAHGHIDAWAREGRLHEHFPAFGHVQFWWTVRYHLHEVLMNAMPHIRALHDCRGEFGDGRRNIELDNPPEPWWPAAFAAAFPEAAITVRRSRPPVAADRFAWWTARARRAWASWRRAGRHCTAAVRPILVIGRDRLWTGARDEELGPVIDALQSQNHRCTIMGSSSGDAAQRAAALRSRPDDHLFTDRFVFDHVLRHGRPPRPELPEIDSPLVVDGINLQPVVDFVLDHAAASLWPQQWAFHTAVPRFIEQLQPRAVVLTDENGGNHALKLGLHAAGVPAIAVQHGLIHPDHLAYMYPPEARPETAGLCTQTCVYGPYQRELLTDHSIYPSNAVAVTGQPQSDRFEAPKEPCAPRSAEAEARRSSVLPGGGGVLLLFSSQHLFRARYGPPLLRAFRETPEHYRLVVRPHPMETDLAWWDRLVQECGVSGRVSITREGSLAEWLDACDVHIAAGSTVLMEAVLHGRPNIVVGANELGDWTGVIEAGLATDFNHAPSLTDAVEALFNPGDDAQQTYAHRRDAFIQHRFHAIDGQAGQRIAGVVNAVIQNA